MNTPLAHLLRVIRGGHSVGSLVDTGVSYVEIGRLIARAVESGLVEPVDGRLVLSRRGEEYLMRSAARLDSPRGLEAHLTEAVQHRIPKVGVADPYLPAYRNSFFDS